MRTWLYWVMALATAACGDNSFPEGEPIAPAENLAIVAHQDDDLLFMQPDLYQAVQHGAGVTNVYVTAGNGHAGVELAELRYGGLMAAYSAIANADDWACGWIELAGHAVEHCRLAAANVSLVFLGYPDGGKEGTEPNSLLHLWERRVQSVRTVARRETTYDQQGLITVLSEIIGYTNPATLRTLDFAATHGHDHSDHLIVGALAVVATARSTIETELVSYRGYNTAGEPRNFSPVHLTRELDALAHYEACVAGCAPCGSACTLDQIVPLHYEWLQHRYAIGVRRTADGLLRLGDGCVSASAPGRAAIVDCVDATTWHLDAHGTLRTGELCLRAMFSGEIVAGSCNDHRAGSRFFLDDEGHLWSGIVPLPQDDMVMAHLDCVVASGGRPRAVLCGAGHAPSWEFARTMTATPRDTTTITRTGRAVRMARLRGTQAMVCAVETGTRGLMCAPSTDGGELLHAVRIDSSIAPLTVEPESLVLGDVDGDGLTDACGRDASGILCATAAGDYQARPWSPMLGGTGPATPTDRSLSITPGGKICGLGSAGVVCVSKDSTTISDVRSTWPDRGAALWIADLDGDRVPDWCAATPAGPACSLAIDSSLTTDGVAWGYSEDGRVEGSEREGAIPDTAVAVFTDIDGDGRDDLCSARDGVIACARSLGRGFGPRTTVARLPADMVPTAVWAEPARDERAPRVCAADATTIACTD